MVWPSLISVAEAPGPYLAACARTFWPKHMAARAADAANQRAGRRDRCFMMLSPRLAGNTSREIEASILPATRRQAHWCLRAGPAPQPGPDHADEPGHARRHDVHEREQEDPVDGPGGRLRDLVREIGHELDEQGSVD